MRSRPRVRPRPYGHRQVALLGRRAGVRYTQIMTRTLDAAMAKHATLPPEEQDRVANWLLEELQDEEDWNRRFAASQDLLSKLSAEALAEYAEGRTTPLDPEKM